MVLSTCLSISFLIAHLDTPTPSHSGKLSNRYKYCWSSSSPSSLIRHTLIKINHLLGGLQRINCLKQTYRSSSQNCIKGIGLSQEDDKIGKTRKEGLHLSATRSGKGSQEGWQPMAGRDTKSAGRMSTIYKCLPSSLFLHTSQLCINF